MLRTNTSKFVFTPGATPNATPPGTPRKIEQLCEPYDMLSPVKASKLKSNINASTDIKSTIQFKISLMLRSAYFDRKDASRKEALTEAQSVIAVDPTHNLANYILGLHELEVGNRNEAILHLQRAANFNNLPESVPHDHGAEVLGLAAYRLAKIFLAQRNYIAAAAWLVHALLAKSPEATREFLDNTFVPMNFILPHELCNTPNTDRGEWRSTYALTQIIFILVVANRQKIGSELEFASADWLKQLPNQEDVDIYNGAIAERKLLIPNSDEENDQFPQLAPTSHTFLKDALEKAVANDPYIIYDVTTYCYHQGIITSELYGKILHHLANTRDPDLSNKVDYGLYKVSLQNNDNERAKGFFVRLLNNHFNGFSLDELGLLKQDITERDQLYHELFIGFCLGGQLNLALECLRRISPAFVNYDATIVTFFNNPEPDYKVYQLKQKVITYILANYYRESLHEDHIMQQLNAVYNRNYNVSAQISAAILHCNDLLQNHLTDMRSSRQRRPFFYFFHDHLNFTNNFSKMQKLATQMGAFATNQLLTHPDLTNNEQTYIQLQKTALDIIATGISDEELHQVCQHATNILNNINFTTPELKSQNPHNVKPAPRKRLDFDNPPSTKPPLDTVSLAVAAAAFTAVPTLTRSRSSSSSSSTSSLPANLASPSPHESAVRRPSR